MRKLFKIIKFLFLTFIGLILLGLLAVYVGHKWIYPIPYSETQTVPDIKSDGFCLGIGCQQQPKTADEFIKIFADQVKNYNQNAASFWPDNKVTNLYALVQSIEHNKAWMVSPQGEIQSLTKDEVKKYAPVRNRYNIGFNYFEHDSIKGVYLALSEETLTNLLEFEQYRHLGTYDLFLTYSHEMFHYLEQPNWKSTDDIKNRGRDDFYSDVDSRVIRNQIYQQILDAVAENDSLKRNDHVLNALALYKKYKTDHNQDYENGKYFDRTEGTAQYFEFVSSLYSAYPKQVNSEQSLEKALTLLASQTDPYQDVGLVKSGYLIGGWTCVLLDKIQPDKNAWKEQMMNNPDLTPLDLLEQIYGNSQLPEAAEATAEIKQKVEAEIQKEQDKKVAPGIFRMLYQLLF